MSERDRIIDYITRNRVSTTEIADAIGKTGVMRGPAPLVPDLHVVGRIHPVFAANGSNYDVHDQLRDTPRGSVVVIFVQDCDDRAILGELVSRYVLLYRGARAIIIDGLARDAARLRREGFPIWAHGVTPLGCVNRPMAPFDPQQASIIRAEYGDGVAVCDDGGVVLLSADWMSEDMLRRLERIELQEDIWSYCLNTLKWDTKEIVCDKRYVDEPEVLPEAFRTQLDDLRAGF